MPTVMLTTDDPNDNAFGFDNQEVTLANGVGQATMTPVTQNNQFSPNTNPARNLLGWKVTAVDEGALYAADISTWIATWPNDVTQLRLLTPNQQAVEGVDPVGNRKNGNSVGGDRRSTIRVNGSGCGPILELEPRAGSQSQCQQRPPNLCGDQRYIFHQSRDGAAFSGTTRLRQLPASVGSNQFNVNGAGCSNAGGFRLADCFGNYC